MFTGEGWLAFFLYRRWAKLVNRKLFKENKRLKREKAILTDAVSQMKVQLEACQEAHRNKRRPSWEDKIGP